MEEKPFKLILKLGNESKSMNIPSCKVKIGEPFKRKDVSSNDQNVTNIGCKKIKELIEDETNNSIDSWQSQSSISSIPEESSEIKLQGENKRTCVLKSLLKKETPFQECLYMLIDLIEKKDHNGFFAWPVNDTIAPGYSEIISEPMDINTIRTKISNNAYHSLNDFHRDIKLLCDNATTYNQPDTIYYKTAKNLYVSTLKYLSKEQFVKYKKKYDFIEKLTDEQLNINSGETNKEKPNILTNCETLNEDILAINSLLCETEPKDIQINFESLPNSNSFENLENTDVENSSQILTSDNMLNIKNVNFATPTSMNKDPLQHRYKNIHSNDTGTTSLPLRTNFYEQIGFKRVNENGLTSLPFCHKQASTKNHTKIFSNLEGLSVGTDILTNNNDDLKNEPAKKVKKVQYLDTFGILDERYNPFCSYAPFYDSTNANICKAHSDFLDYHSSLKDPDNSFQELMEEHLKNFNGNTNETNFTLLTNEDIAFFQESQLMNKLRSQKEDTPNLEHFKSENLLDSYLHSSSKAITSLEKVQNLRLSQPIKHLSLLHSPSNYEQKIAEQVKSNLINLMKHAKPKDVADINTIHKLIGI